MSEPDADLRRQLQSALIEKLRFVPADDLVTVRIYVRMICALNEGWEMPELGATEIVALESRMPSPSAEEATP